MPVVPSWQGKSCAKSRFLHTMRTCESLFHRCHVNFGFCRLPTALRTFDCCSCCVTFLACLLSYLVTPLAPLSYTLSFAKPVESFALKYFPRILNCQFLAH